VAFDWSASGIWLDDPPSNSPTEEFANRSGLRPWSELVSRQLLDDIQQWNNDQDDVSRIWTDPDETLEEEIRMRARALAERLLDELGCDWDVCYKDDRGVRIPVQRTQLLGLVSALTVTSG